MFEKNLTIEYLLDFYGDVLEERPRKILSAYYGEDLSLSEIAAEVGISRQGVRHVLKKGEEQLFFMEERLGLARRYQETAEAAERLSTLAAPLLASEDGRVRALAEEAEALSALLGK